MNLLVTFVSRLRKDPVRVFTIVVINLGVAISVIFFSGCPAGRSSGGGAERVYAIVTNGDAKFRASDFKGALLQYETARDALRDLRNAYPDGASGYRDSERVVQSRMYLALSARLLLKHSPANLTLVYFNKMKLGMSYEDVVKILGSEGTESNRDTDGKDELRSYKWQGGESIQVDASFRKNKLWSKTQFGLGGGDADISKTKYDKLRNGMSYADVERIVGSEGEKTMASTIGKVTHSSYAWNGRKFTRITVIFTDGKVTGKSQLNLK